MPTQQLTVASFCQEYGDRLGLSWLAGESGSERVVVSPEDAADPSSLVGHISLIHPHPIQVIASAEFDYLHSLGEAGFKDAISRLFNDGCVAVIVAEGLEPEPLLIREAERSGTALLGSTLSSGRLVEFIDYYLRKSLAVKTVVHGVFLEVLGIGVLLTGESAIGKSELALELISRGHRLIADDAPEFVRIAPDTLRGECPPPLRDFLEVRGLGVLNVRAMFGNNAIKTNKNLRLIIHLLPLENAELESLDRLQGSQRFRPLLDVEVPEIQLLVAPGRNLAVLVEAAVRNHILSNDGYNATEDFIRRQHAYIEQDDA